MLQGPNREMLEAQARVCTGPHQSRRLVNVKTISSPHRCWNSYSSLCAEIWWEMSAFPRRRWVRFAAMCIRRVLKKTGWSVAEHAAFDRAAQRLNEMPKTLQFILRGEGEPEALSGEDE